MSKRKIIKIDDAKCNGCGLCIPNCPEGALKVIDGKARLISDLFCDGLGACIGHCPEGAITIAKGGTNGYGLLGAAFSVALAPGAEIQALTAAGSPAVGSSAKTLDLSGTGTDVLEVAIILG